MIAPPSLRRARLAICLTCPHLRPTRVRSAEKCALCGCAVRLKAALRAFRCPLKKW